MALSGNDISTLKNKLQNDLEEDIRKGRIERIEILCKNIKYLDGLYVPTKVPVFNRPLVIVSICLLLLFLALHIRRASTPVTVDIFSDELTFRTSSVLKLNAGNGDVNYAKQIDSVLIDHIDSLVVNGIPELATYSYGDVNELKIVSNGSKNIEFDELLIDSSSVTKVSTDSLHFSIEGKVLHGKFLLKRGNVSLNGKVLNANVIDGKGEYVEFFAKGVTGMDIYTNEPIQVVQVPVDSISLVKESRNGLGDFISSIDSAHIRIHETGNEVDVNYVSKVGIKSSRIANIVLWRLGSRLKATFQDNVYEISQSTRGFNRNLVPSLLEYLYNDKIILLYFSAFTFLIAGYKRIRDFVSRS